MANSPRHYELLDCGHQRKLERFGKVVLTRPSASAVWPPRWSEQKWQQLSHGAFVRSHGGQGKWHWRQPPPREPWPVQLGELEMLVQPTEFGHMGLFPEHCQVWSLLQCALSDKQPGYRPKVLNLFAYTGWASFACLKLGAEVVHVDASKASVSWARDNAKQNGFADHPIRWIVDDVRKFCRREQRRGVRYDGIILDPPSYGRGAKGEVWKIEQDLNPLLEVLNDIAAPELGFWLLSSHSPGYTPLSLRQLLCTQRRFQEFHEGELYLSASQVDQKLPSGAFAFGFGGVK